MRSDERPSGIDRRRRSTGCLGALVGLVLLVCLNIVVDSGFSALPRNGWMLAGLGTLLLGVTVGAIRLARRDQARVEQDVAERGWQRSGTIAMQNAPIVEQTRFVSHDEAKAELACGQTTLNVLAWDGLDPCWSESGERGFTRESVDAEAAYRRTVSRARLFVRTLGRGLAKGV